MFVGAGGSGARVVVCTEEVGARAGVVLVPDRKCGGGCFMFIAAGGDLLLEYDMEEGPAGRLRRGGGVGVGGVGVVVVVQVPLTEYTNSCGLGPLVLEIFVCS